MNKELKFLGLPVKEAVTMDTVGKLDGHRWRRGLRLGRRGDLLIQDSKELFYLIHCVHNGRTRLLGIWRGEMIQCRDSHAKAVE